jgi:hypothetical protein
MAFCSIGAAVVALIVLGTAPAAPLAATKKTVTFHLVEKSVGFNFIDNPPRQGPRAAPLIGDQIAFTSELQSTSGAHTGWLEATCTIARGGTRAEGPCYGVFALKGGTLMAMAQTKFYGNTPTDIVIVGGTGVYQGVTGSILSVTKNDSINNDTVTLNWS